MTADPIRAALDAAACALCREAQSCHGDCGGKCAWRDGEVDMPACAAAAGDAAWAARDAAGAAAWAAWDAALDAARAAGDAQTAILLEYLNGDRA